MLATRRGTKQAMAAMQDPLRAMGLEFKGLKGPGKAPLQPTASEAQKGMRAGRE